MTDHLNEVVSDNGCPKCGSANVSAVKYTWWGGLLGPKMFHYTKCNECKFTYNARTRKSNTGPIVIYSVVAFVVFFIIFFMLFKNMR